MPRHRAASTASSRNSLRSLPPGQEMASMYDYLAKIILLGPSGAGKSCLLHRFVKHEWRVLSSQTVGVEFASKIVKVGTGPRRKRIKLQLWDTAGTERFRSVSRSYYRGAAGAVLVYDVADRHSFAQLPTFLADARALASPQLAAVLVGNKLDLAQPGAAAPPRDFLGDGLGSSPSAYSGGTVALSLGPQLRATTARSGRAVEASVAAGWAAQNRIPARVEVSALSGEGVDEVFAKLASTILTKIELGEIDPDDSMSGIQYGDADYYRWEDGGSVKSGLTSEGFGGRRARRRGRSGWGACC